MSGPWEKYVDQSTGPWSKYAQTPPVDPAAPIRAANEAKTQSYLANQQKQQGPTGFFSNLGSSLKSQAEGLGNTLTAPPQGGVEKALSIAPPLLSAKRMFVDPVLEQNKQAAQNFEHGNVAEGMGHFLAQTPVVGPAAALLGESIGQHAGRGDWSGAAGQVAGAALPMIATEGAVKGAPLLKAGAEKVGLGLGNDALGAKGANAFKYGQNAARGAYEEGVLPAWSKTGAQLKVEPAIESTGAKIGKTIEASPNRIALRDIKQSIEQPLNESRAVIRGPGGGGRSTAPLDSLQESMTNKAPNAESPVYGPNAGTPYTAEEAMRVISQAKHPLLEAPKQEIPLASTRGRNPQMSPMAFDAGVNPEEPYTPRTGEVMPPISRYPVSNPHYLSGSEHPEMSGRVPVSKGVLLRSPEYPESTQPSGLADLRHPEATAPDLWHTIRNVDKNTRFNPDPEVEGANEVRRSMRGGMSENLKQAVPEVKPLMQRYADLKEADTGLSKTMHNGTNLGTIMNSAKFPLQTAAGRLLYEGGKLIPNIDPNLAQAFPAIAAAAQKPKDKK